jgi:hypothetical protein
VIANAAAEALLGPNAGIGMVAVFTEGMKAMARLTLEVGDKICPNCGADVTIFPGGVVCESGCAFTLTAEEAKTRVCKSETSQDEK